MQWEHPNWLQALWILPVVAGLLVHAHRRRMAAARAFVDQQMVARLMPALQGPRPWIKGGLLLLAIALFIVAAARPRFGVYFEEVSARGVDLFVVVDVSRSMLAEDVAPNRLDRAKSDIRDLLPHLAGDRVGLIAFARSPVVVVPLTSDQGFFRNALEDLDIDSAPRGGTLIGDAIRKAAEAMDPRHDRDQVVVLITDGEDHESYPVEAARAAHERGIKIIAIGLGDPTEGARIPIRDPAGGLAYVRKDDGQEHWSRMDERPLKEIALASEGAYIPAKTKAYDLGEIYQKHLAGLRRGQYEAEKRRRYADRFPIFLWLGLAAIALEMVIPPYEKRSE